jgi:hypothetical protein
MELIAALKTVNVDRIDVEEQVVLLSQGSALKATFEGQKFPVPEWLNDSLEKLGTEIKRRRIDQIQLALKQAQAKVDGLKSTEQKRNEAAAELDRLQKMLAEG